MIEPAKYNVTMYRGVDFTISFRIKVDSVAQDLTNWAIRFKASLKPEGTEIFNYATGQSPAHITLDADDNTLATVTILSTETDVDHPSLYYELDTTDEDGSVARRLYGTITIPRNA